jgi:hypothetical protein
LADYHLRFNKNENKKIIELLNNNEPTELVDYCTSQLAKKNPNRHKKKEKEFDPLLKYCNDINSEIFCKKYIELLNNNEIKGMITDSFDMNDLKSLIFMDYLLPMIDENYSSEIINSELNPEQKALNFAKEYQIYLEINKLHKIFSNLNDKTKNFQNTFLNSIEYSKLEKLRGLVHARSKLIENMEKYLYPEDNVSNKEFLPKGRILNNASLSNMIKAGFSECKLTLNKIEVHIREEIKDQYTKYQNIKEEILNKYFNSYKNINKLKEKRDDVENIVKIFNLLGDPRLDNIKTLSKNITSKINNLEKVINERNRINSYIQKIGDYLNLPEAKEHNSVFHDDISFLSKIKTVILDSNKIQKPIYDENKDIIQEYKSYVHSLINLFDKKIKDNMESIRKKISVLDKKYEEYSKDKIFFFSFKKKRNLESLKKEVKSYQNIFNEIRKIAQK